MIFNCFLDHSDHYSQSAIDNLNHSERHFQSPIDNLNHSDRHFRSPIDKLNNSDPFLHHQSWTHTTPIASSTFGTDFVRSEDCATSCLVMTFMLRVIKLLVRNQSVCSWILPFVLWPITKKSHTFRCSSPLLYLLVCRLCWTISRRNPPFCVAEDEFCSGEHVD